MNTPIILGIIPARGGSKGIPRKNIKNLGGKPLIVYGIEAALTSKYNFSTVVSTEDQEIAQIAEQAGAMIIDRPIELASDETPSLPVIQHAIRYYENKINHQIDYSILIQATTPFINAMDIDGAIDKIIITDSDSVISVCEVTHFHPNKLKRIENDQLVPFFNMEAETIRRQDLPSIYIRNGGIYATKRDVVMQENSLYGTICRPYIMPPERSINIDDNLDWILAEGILQNINKP